MLKLTTKVTGRMLIFANEAVMKLLKFGVIEEVPKSSLICVNPLTVAQNYCQETVCV